ncbi:MAG: carboxypeptidase regulatory-like domain-containing protein, partial [Natronosporangium sp.]
VPAREAGWEVLDALDQVEVVIMQSPPELDQAEFLAALDTFDRAGVSVIFPADGWSTGSRGLDMLVEHTGSPSDYGRIGGSLGQPVFLQDLAADHPVFAGIPDPVQLLNADADAAHFPDYRGVVLAQVAEAGEEPAGIGVAYDVRTPDSVHLLLTGLASGLSNRPDESWTPEGGQIFLNAVRWAADPGLGAFTGTVTDPAEQPLPQAEVEVVGTNWRAVTGPDGEFEIGVPAGEHTVRYRAFGYATVERVLTVGAGQARDVSAQLEVGTVGTISGVVTPDEGDGGIGTAQVGTASLAGVSVTLRGTPRRTVTAADGSFSFELVEPGSYDLELEADGHLRTLAPVQVAASQHTVRDVALRTSPLVGIIDDSDATATRDRGAEFLADWGYRVEEIGWDSLDRIADLDLVVANRGNANSSSDPGAAGLHAFLEAVNRAGVSVLWLDQNGRGAIRFLTNYDGDPAGRGQDANDGPVTATVLADHPLVAGVPDQFELLAPGNPYAWFEDFGGTTVASLTTNLGTVGGTIGYRGRTAGAVDVLLSTMSIGTNGGPATRQSPAHRWTPAAERVFVNALAWA